MNSRITTDSSQRGHIQDAANVLSATPYTGFSDEAAGGEVIRSDADEGCYLLAIELPQFRQLGQQSRAGMRADAGCAAENFIFFAEVIVGFDVLADEFIELGDLIVERFNHFADALTNLRMADSFASIQLLGAQVSKLSAATNQVGQLIGLGADGRFGLRLNDLSETCEDCGIDGVGFGELANASREVTNLSWRGNDDFEIRLKQFGDDGAFVTASCFEDYQRNVVRLKGFDELFCARETVGQGDVDCGRTRGDVECLFGNVDANEKRFCHGLLPILQMRTRRTHGSAVHSAVRVGSTVAARITLRDGLADQDTTDLSSPAFSGSARYARLTAKRIYYGTFNHD